MNYLIFYKSDKYLSPVSGKITTINFPQFSLRTATLQAAKIAAPEEIPHKIPSLLAVRRDVSKASSLLTLIISSIVSIFSISGIKPGPVPGIL
jgi:hypothetical protein